MRRLALALVVLAAPTGAGAAITYVGAGTLVNTTGNQAVNAPTGYAANDVCILLAVSNDTQTHSITGGTGWTNLAANTTTNSTSVWWKRMSSGSETAPTLTRSVNTARILARQLCWRGAATGTSPTIGTWQTNTTTAGGTLGTATPAVTTTIDNSLVLHLVAFTNTTNATAAVSSPTGINGTTLSSGFSAGGTSTTRNGIAFYSALKTPAGSSGTSNLTTTQADTVRSGHVIIPREQTTSDAYTETATASDSLAVCKSGEVCLDTCATPTASGSANSGTVTSAATGSLCSGGSSRVVVCGIAEANSNPTNWSPPTLAWTSANGACTSFTKQVDANYSGGDKGATIWTATCSSSFSGIGVTATPATGSTNASLVVACQTLQGASSTITNAGSATWTSAQAAQVQLTGVAAGSRLFVAAGVESVAALTPFTNTTELLETTNAGGPTVAAVGFNAVDTGAVTVGWSTSATWGAVAAIEVPAAAGGPQTYTDSFTETATASDSISQSVTLPNALTEAVTSGDSLTAGMVYADAVTESATASDSLASASTLRNSYSEAASAGDSSAQNATLPNAFSESSSPADSLAAGMIYSNTLTESAAPGDAQAASATYPQSYSEATSAGEGLTSVQTMLQAFSETPAANFTETDNLVPGGGGTVYSDSFTEAATATDGVGVGLVMSQSFTEQPATNSSLLKVWDGSQWK